MSKETGEEMSYKEFAEICQHYKLDIEPFQNHDAYYVMNKYRISLYITELEIIECPEHVKWKIKRFYWRHKLNNIGFKLGINDFSSYFGL